jgi:hypothetical protein
MLHVQLCTVRYYFSPLTRGEDGQTLNKHKNPNIRICSTHVLEENIPKERSAEVIPPPSELAGTAYGIRSIVYCKYIIFFLVC